MDNIEVKLNINRVFDSLKALLQYKNEKYGDSALTPINIFSKLDAETGLLVRLDDKLARIKNGKDLRKNDVADIMGYLALLSIKNGWTDFSEFKD